MPILKYKEISQRSSRENGNREEEGDLEARPFISNHRYSNRPQKVWNFNVIAAFLNIILGIILVACLGIISRSAKLPFHSTVLDPYSPALEAIVPVLTRFKPARLYQSEPSPEVETAWLELIGPYQGIVAIDAEDSAKLAKSSHESVESPMQPGKHLYAPSVFHQLHCLNHIRKAFYREIYYSEIDDKEFLIHKSILLPSSANVAQLTGLDHCIDFLRQVIMCHADLSMTYWWNDTYTTINDHGATEYTQQYLNFTPGQRSFHSEVQWNIEHKCRALEPIKNWVREHALVPPSAELEH
ncbi:MAG: hypothetical protein M1814_003885 [Vezdaea aestivalis]|nr:MAG: hypothetical protein M1814_003885 [Vezdaea aestivalis]